MKKISVLMLAICSTMIFGQKVSDYKYVSVPAKFETFKDNFGLEALLTKTLKGKKYEVLSANKDQWPSEAKGNACNVINADVLNDKNLFRNKVILQFKDCNNKLILESKGSSYIKEFEEGLQDALQQALIKVGMSNPVEILPAQNPVSENNEAPSIAPVASNYSNGKLNLQKIQIDGNQFILAKTGDSVPFAIFTGTSKKDVFIVKLADKNTTIGYFENGNIVIDIPNTDGKVSKEVFVGK
ncbi:hypothetical protein EGI16_12800 [Chryseobacterium sp. G0240]|uniref:hypothetical protein n=1 Tax=Chryseobacterium sp. G0240 TaxID=2487066 RepID=UPI000F455118|nr:hypothetical protein [Chryseobacterium sp. G0240]ROI03036.1 hypothetical protein EGI16_12800 [Chryseobacterium sp. G0240]